MTINQSRVRNGVLKLGPTSSAFDVSCQVTNVRITPSYSDDGSTLTVLCGDVVGPARIEDTTHLNGTVVQDFDWPEAQGGVVDYTWNHNLEIVPFTFTPSDASGGPTYTGTVTIEKLETGGPVNGQLTADFLWIANNVQRTYATATAAESTQTA